MASTIPRRGINTQKLQGLEEVYQVFTERFKVKFGEWLLQGAVNDVSSDSEVHLALATNPLQGQKLPAEGVSPLDEDSSGDNADAEPDTYEGTSPAEAGIWPLRYALTGLNEESTLTNMAQVTGWVQDWHQCERDLPAGVTVHWLTRRWPKLGEQTLPVAVTVESVEVLAQWAGSARRWKRACARRDGFIARFEIIRHSTLWSRHCEVLADWAEEDIERLQGLLGWFLMNPSSGLYLRQLPVPRIDTKWVETRKAVVRDFVLTVNGQPISGAAQDFYEVCGLRKPAPKLRLRILCPTLRASLGGLCDIEAPVEEVAQMSLPIRGAFIVENLETGLALPDFDGMVAFMRLGYAISELARIPWLRPDHLEHAASYGPLPQLVYWGDLDTHGFAILSMARKIFSRLHSVLMDKATFLNCRELWVSEKTPSRIVELKYLMPVEQSLYVELRENKWGVSLRLEQERLPWSNCMQALQEFVISQP